MLAKAELSDEQRRAIAHLFEYDEAILVAPTGVGKTVICLTAIDDWYDDSGDDCTPEDASFCVAREGDQYWSIDLSKFERTEKQ